MSVKALLQLLEDGEFHSGKDLGEFLGVSRTAVWKQLQKLEDLGLSLSSVKGQGYQIPGGLELLDKEQLLSGLTPAARGCLRELDLLDVCESTNVLAMSRAEAGAGAGYVCLAEYQTAGRGRRGRQWVSPYGGNIYLSAVAEFQGGVAELEGLSLAVGVGLVRALQNCDVEGVQLKWPNDVLWRGRKLAGILIEMTGDVTGLCQVVVGVGVNVKMPGAASSAIDQPWVDIASIVPEVSRNRIAVEMLNELLPLLANYAHIGFASYQREWESLHAHQGLVVELHSGSNPPLIGRAEGVSRTGALKLRCGDQLREVSGGEVSLRVAP